MQLSHKFKKIFFSFVPYKLVRFLFKYVSVDFVRFGHAKKDTGTYLLRDCSLPDVSFEVGVGADPLIQAAFKRKLRLYKSHHGLLCEYILQCDDCYVEPQFGWGITANEELIFDSIANNAWIESYHPSYELFKKNKQHAVYYPKLLSVRMIRGGELNYWHFLHDLLGQIALAHRYGLHLPVLVSRKLYEAPFFSKALQQSHALRSITWIVQDKQFIKGGQIYFLQRKPHQSREFFGVLKLLEIKDSDPGTNRRIFLVRNKSRIRFVQHLEGLANIAAQYGFETIDADTLDFSEQIRLFSQTGYLVGIHGAGLTNIMFRLNAPMRVLELIPQDYLEPHYCWLAKAMGHQYICQVGSASAYDTSFRIDPATFEKNIQQLLKL